MMFKMRRLSTQDAGFSATLKALLAFETAQDADIDATVAAILAQVKQRGDAAVLEYTAKFDRLTAKSLPELELSHAKLEAAFKNLAPDAKTALQAAAERVRVYH